MNIGNADHSMPSMPKEIVTLNYAMIKSPEKTTLPNDAPVKGKIYTHWKYEPLCVEHGQQSAF